MVYFIHLIFSSHIFRRIAGGPSVPCAISRSTLLIIAETPNKFTRISVWKWYQNPFVSHLLQLEYVNPQSLDTDELKSYKHLLNGSKGISQQT